MQNKMYFVNLVSYSLLIIWKYLTNWFSLYNAFKKYVLYRKPKVPLDDPFGGQLPACAQLKFRSFDGTCNNIAFPDRGSTSSIFLRLLDPEYSDCKFSVDNLLPSIDVN